MRSVLAALREKGFRALMSVHGVDYWPHEPRLGVHYELLDMHEVDRITVKTRVPTDAPTVPSVTPDWPTADFHEREVYDLFGVVFEGHPDLRRILMPDDYEGHPQRRDFPVGGEPVHFTYNEYETPRYWESTDSTDLAPAELVTGVPALADEDSDELLTINMGPHHPATHGVLRVMVKLDGEVVKDAKPVIGYLHTGIEKTAEDKSYWKVIPVVERMDYLAYYFNAMAYVGAVETLLDVEVPPRAQYLRVIHLELNRIMSHLVWIGTAMLDLGAISMFWYGFREREQILDLFEYSSGQRMHTRYFQVGGVIEDIPVGLGGQGAQVLRGDAAPRRPVRGDPGEERDRPAAPARHRGRARGAPARARRHRPAAARGRQPVGPAQGRALLELRPLRLQDPGRHRGRQLRPLPRAPRRALREREDHRAGARRPARGPVHHRGPQGRAAAAPRARHLDGGAHPPLQARDRGLPRAAGRGLLPDRGPARRARLLRALRRLLQARARAHARLELHQPAGVPRHGPDGYIADFIAAIAMLDPIVGGIDR